MDPVSRVLQIGEEVLGAGNERLGQVQRLVVDETAHRVTHVVVGDRLVSARRLRDAGPNALRTDLSRADFDHLPAAGHGHVSGPRSHWNAPLGYRLENFLAIASALVGQAPYQPPVHLDAGLEAAHEITHGSPVWSGNRRVGEVEQVLAGVSGTVTELIVRLPGLRGRRVRLGVERVIDTVGNNVHVVLSEDDEAALPDATG